MAGGRLLTPEQQFAGERGLVAPGSKNYEFWVISAAEVGINARGVPIDTGQVFDERARVVAVMGLAPIDKIGWSWEHARAARLVTAIRQTRYTVNLASTNTYYLPNAIRATWVHVEGVVPPEEAAALGMIALDIEEHIDTVRKFARMDRELLDLSVPDSAS